MKRLILAIICLSLSLMIFLSLPILASPPVKAFLFANPVIQQDTQDTTQAPMLPVATLAPFLTVIGSPPVVNTKAAYLLDSDTGHTLDDSQGELPLPMASTTKVMTALVAIQMADANRLITVNSDAVNESLKNFGSSAHLIAGDQLPLKDLLYALMLPSGDDAAIAIADGLAGSPENFVKIMNSFALRLHLFQTHYINPDGLTYYQSTGQPVPGQYTTAYDLTRLAQYALRLPLFAQIVKTLNYSIPWSTSHQTYTWQNTNGLLTGNTDYPASGYAGVTGVKTGFTTEAGYCLVFSATRAGHHLIGAVLFSSNTDTTQRFRDAKTLLNWGFGLPMLTPAI